MATSYTNYAKTVSDAFRTILRDEFTATYGSPNIEIVLSDVFEPERLATKSEYARYWIESDVLVSQAANGETRDYNIGCYYYVDIYKKNIQRDWETLLSDRVEHIKTMISNNVSYAPSSVYKWHNAVVSEVGKPMTVSESDGIDIAGYENIRVVKLTVKITRGNF
jgi:hypothetical protein